MNRVSQKVKYYVRIVNRVYHVIKDELLFSDEEAAPRIVYKEYKPQLLKPKTVLDKHDYIRIRKVIRFLRQDRDIIPFIKYAFIGLCVFALIALGVTLYQRLHQKIIYGTYIEDYRARIFTIRVLDSRDKNTYVIDYGRATIYDRNGNTVRDRKTLFENDPHTGWKLGDNLKIRIEKRDSEGIYEANEIINYSLP